MMSLPLALVAVWAFIGLSFGSHSFEEQRVLEHDPYHEILSSKEVVGVGFDLTASYGLVLAAPSVIWRSQ